MNRSLAALFLLLTAALAGCSSIDNSKAELIPPQFVVRQTNTVGPAAEHVSGGIPVSFAIDVMNPSAETLTLYQIRLESMGHGAYFIEPTQKPFDRKILPDHVETVEMWVPAVAQDTIVGVNGPVTVRGTAFFHSAVGSFQKIFIQTVNDGLGGQRPPR